MQVLLQTRFNSPSTIYDTDAPVETSRKTGIGKIVMNIFKPYVQVKEGNVSLYQINKPYPDESGKWQFIAGAVGLVAVVGTASLIFGLGRISKK